MGKAVEGWKVGRLNVEGRSALGALGALKVWKVLNVERLNLERGTDFP
jgi:hypothetical protein